MIPLGTGNDLARSAEIHRPGGGRTGSRRRNSPSAASCSSTTRVALSSTPCTWGSARRPVGPHRSGSPGLAWPHTPSDPWIAGCPSARLAAADRGRPGARIRRRKPDPHGRPRPRGRRSAVVRSSRPDAEPDDGLVDVVISYAVGPVARLGYALHLRRGDHVQRDDVHATLANTVTISGQPFPWNADGELGCKPIRRRTWVVQRRAWHLLVPNRAQDETARRALDRPPAHERRLQREAATIRRCRPSRLRTDQSRTHRGGTPRGAALQARQVTSV